MAAEEATLNPIPSDQTNESSQPAVPASTPASESPSAFVASPLFWLALLIALNMVMPFVPVPNAILALAGTLALTIIYVIVIVQFTAQFTRLQWSPGKIVPLFLLCLVLWAVLQWYVAPAVMEPLANAANEARANKVAPPPLTTGQQFTILLLQTFTGLALMVTAVTGGSLVSRIITSPNMLGPVCAIIAMIDIWGVLFGGIVSQLMEKAPEVAVNAMVRGPGVGGATASRFQISLPDIGVGDYLFLGLLFAVLHTHRLNWRDAIKWTVPLIVVALLAVNWGVGALPGLLFIGLGVAIPNWKYFEYTREEKFALLYAGIFVVILTGILYVSFTKMLNEHEMKNKTQKTRQVERLENGHHHMARLNRSLSL